jgi:hypothetical protein
VNVLSGVGLMGEISKTAAESYSTSFFNTCLIQKQRHTVSTWNREDLTRNGLRIVDQTFIGGLLVSVLYRGSQQPQSFHASPQRKK